MFQKQTYYVQHCVLVTRRSLLGSFAYLCKCLLVVSAGTAFVKRLDSKCPNSACTVVKSRHPQCWVKIVDWNAWITTSWSQNTFVFIRSNFKKYCVSDAHVQNHPMALWLSDHVGQNIWSLCGLAIKWLLSRSAGVGFRICRLCSPPNYGRLPPWPVFRNEQTFLIGFCRVSYLPETWVWSNTRARLT